MTGAAEALANTLVAQSQVLRDPKLGFWGKMAAYTAIGAAGFGVAASLRGGGSSGGGSSAGATSAPAVSQGQDSSPVAVTIQGLDPESLYSGKQVIGMTDAVQKEFKRRGVVLSFTS